MINLDREPLALSAHLPLEKRYIAAAQLDKLTQHGLPCQSALAMWRLHCNTDSIYLARLSGISQTLALALDQEAIHGAKLLLLNLYEDASFLENLIHALHQQ